MNSYARYSDMELADLLKEGDQQAYTAIYDRYKTLLYIFTLRRLGDREESKDLISDLFTAIWSNHSTITLKSSLSAYLYTSARNRIIDLITHKQVQSRYIDSFQGYLDQGEDNADHLVRSKELTALIDLEISALPIKMREVFLLSRETYLSRAEIAIKLGISEETVKSHMHHAIKILKARLNSFFFIVFL